MNNYKLCKSVASGALKNVESSKSSTMLLKFHLLEQMVCSAQFVSTVSLSLGNMFILSAGCEWNPVYCPEGVGHVTWDGQSPTLLVMQVETALTMAQE